MTPHYSYYHFSFIYNEKKYTYSLWAADFKTAFMRAMELAGKS